MKVADYVIRFLATQGVTHAFELSGGMLVHLLDAAYRLQLVRLVSCRHEQAAGFAAEGWARMTGVPGVAFATSGPGATNLLTAIASCYFDSTPAIFITGQVNRNEMKGPADKCRQSGFQETDIVAMARPVAKAAWLVTEPSDVPRILVAAFELARGGRPGPVLIDLPMDVSRADIWAANGVPMSPPVFPPPAPRKSTHVLPADVEITLEMFRAAERPLVLVGGGASGAMDPVRQALNHLWVPVVHTLMGSDVLAVDHPLRVGLIGSYGNRWANHALAESDALLVLGSRLDVRQTGSDTSGFAQRKIVHVDVDPSEINRRVRGVHPIVAHLGDFCAALLSDGRSPVNGYGFGSLAWNRHIAGMRARWPDTKENEGRFSAASVNPNGFMRALSDSASMAEVAAYCVDVGQHQMWAAQSLPVHRGQRFLTSGGHGAMGFALPAAIGACFARPDQAVVCVVGDGGMQVNVQELRTIVDYRLPVKVVVMNNDGHGMVAQFQEQYFESRFQSTRPSPPSFVRIAAAYGLPARKIKHPNEVEDTLAWLFRTPGPALLEVDIPREAHALPKLSFGSPLSKMDPPRP